MYFKLRIGSIDKNNEETEDLYDQNDDGLHGLEKNDSLSNGIIIIFIYYF